VYRRALHFIIDYYLWLQSTSIFINLNKDIELLEEEEATFC